MSRAALAKTVGGAGAAATLIALVATWEGKSNDPYPDLRGIATVCYGETNVPMRRYSDAECDAMLAKSLVTYANGVKRLTPSLNGKPLLAASSFAYNLGVPTYERSSVRRRFNAGDIRGGCNAMLAYNKVRVPASSIARYQRRGETCSLSSKGIWYCTVKGLTNRRRDEHRLCVADL